MSVLLFLLLAIAGAAEPVQAAADLERAKTLYANGSQLYEEGLYDKAILAFQEAYAVSKNPKLLYNIANAQERSGDIAGSLDTLNTYRVYAETSESDTLDRRIKALENRLEAEKAKAAAVVAAAAVVPAPVVAAPVVPAVVPEPKPNTLRWVLVGVGAGMTAGFGTVTGISYSSGLDSRDAGNQASYESSRTLNNISLPLTGIGGALLVTGLALPAKRLSVGPGSIALHTTF